MKRGIKGQNLLKKTIIWLLAIIIVLYGVSGFGITEFRIVEYLTFGLFTKKLAFEIHEYLWIPFLVLLGLHVFLPLGGKWLRLTRQP